VLHHGDVAVVGLFLGLKLVLFDISEFDLLKFLGFGIDRWTGKGVVEGRLSCGLTGAPLVLTMSCRTVTT